MVVPSDDERRARLDVMAHFPSLFPSSELGPNDVTLPPRQDAEGYEELDLSFARVPERY